MRPTRRFHRGGSGGHGGAGAGGCASPRRPVPPGRPLPRPYAGGYRSHAAAVETTEGHAEDSGATASPHFFLAPAFFGAAFLASGAFFSSGADASAVLATLASGAAVSSAFRLRDPVSLENLDSFDA